MDQPWVLLSGTDASSSDPCRARLDMTRYVVYYVHARKCFRIDTHLNSVLFTFHVAKFVQATKQIYHDVVRMDIKAKVYFLWCEMGRKVITVPLL